MIDKKALWEATKEPLRWLVLAVIPFVVTYFAALPYQWAVGIVALLRIIDGYLHQAAKALPKRSQREGLLGVRGLTGF